RSLLRGEAGFAGYGSKPGAAASRVLGRAHSPDTLDRGIDLGIAGAGELGFARGLHADDRGVDLRIALAHELRFEAGGHPGGGRLDLCVAPAGGEAHPARAPARGAPAR